MRNSDTDNPPSLKCDLPSLKCQPENMIKIQNDDQKCIQRDIMCTKNESCEKKCVKPIIPKIKASPSSVLIDHAPPNNKQNLESVFKTQKTYHQQYHSRSHIKNFPREEELEKMTKKQLAHTYYQQFLSLNRENEVLEKQLSFVRQERDSLYKRFNELKEEQKNSDQLKPKRQRRVATDIQRNYNCPLPNCDRSYGSEGSLIQHIKIKHQSFFATPQYYAYLSKHTRQES